MPRTSENEQDGAQIEEEGEVRKTEKDVRKKKRKKKTKTMLTNGPLILRSRFEIV